MVLESPNKENISYVVYYMKKTSSLSDYLSWIADNHAMCGGVLDLKGPLR